MKPTRKSKLIDQMTRVKLAEELHIKGIVTQKEVRRERRILKWKESKTLFYGVLIALIALVIAYLKV